MISEDAEIAQRTMVHVTLSEIGQQLKRARSEAGLTLMKVASDLRLSPAQVEAIEEGEADKLPPGPFVRGYVRNYARLFDMHQYTDHELVLDDAISEKPVSTRRSVVSRSQSKSSDPGVRFITYLVVLILLALVLIWWANQSGHLTQLKDAALEAISAESGQPPQPEAQPNQNGDYAMPLPQAQQQLQTPPVSAVVEEQRMSESSVMPTTITPVPEEEAPPAPATKAAAEAVAEMKDEALLRLYFNAASWVQVTDAKGNRVAVGLKKEGHEMNLAGEAPFTVLLGYAPGVDVFYQGNKFDHSSYERKGMARFDVGP
ncbi:MAG: DUF4115 domain-containing protein [Gammaproteobacteria bacterium]|nr:DUF4115 domain-containing protein [Gammaproteobacteria bacterium]